ncbi:MAG: transposase [Planctomycetes bacterium]|nr:transposase [Planctomycetota bacterium]
MTWRGNRRKETFCEGDDYRTYKELTARRYGRCGVEVQAYCLIPNHVHLIASVAQPLFHTTNAGAKLRSWQGSRFGAVAGAPVLLIVQIVLGEGMLR